MTAVLYGEVSGMKMEGIYTLYRSHEDINSITDLQIKYCSGQRLGFEAWKEDTLCWGSNEFITNVISANSEQLEELQKKYAYWNIAMGGDIFSYAWPISIRMEAKEVFNTVKNLLDQNYRGEMELLNRIKAEMSFFSLRCNDISSCDAKESEWI
jgi:hypothetical protein